MLPCRTEKLYETDSHLCDFTAKVLSCEPLSDAEWMVLLDRTAFFPEGGGQPADVGTLGSALVKDVKEQEGCVQHRTDAPVPVGAEVHGHVDWNRRFPMMQLHSGEHIVSGLVRQLHGFDNVGFHMGSDAVTMDFNGELSDLDLREIEERANEAVFANLAVSALYPEPDRLSGLAYRSKKERVEDVRIVSIPGYDACACCGVHVARTGEIGLIKLLFARRYKGGTRVEMVAGWMALRMAS